VAGPSFQVSPVGLCYKVSRHLKKSRINEFNVEDVLTLFLPYHDTPHFAKMVSILRVE
jgi:U3 small nucleolar RNA-associated protein 10